MAVTQSSFTNKGLFGLLVSNTSKRVPLLDLKQLANFTKFKILYVSSDHKNDCFHYILDQAC